MLILNYTQKIKLKTETSSYNDQMQLWRVKGGQALRWDLR